jgi:hypothetical protein
MPTYPANLCLFWWGVKFSGFRKNLGEAIGQAIETAPRRTVWKGAREHSHYVLSGEQRVNNTAQTGGGRDNVRFRLG